MSGIYIRGMEMPGTCVECKMFEYYCPFTSAFKPIFERHPDCPLVPIQNHGRLIDADRLLSNLPEVSYKGSVKRVLMQSPTVLPGDEEPLSATSNHDGA